MTSGIRMSTWAAKACGPGMHVMLSRPSRFQRYIWFRLGHESMAPGGPKIEENTLKKPLDQLFAEASDFDLCNEVFLRIAHLYGKNMDVSNYREVERIVILVWHSMGLIGNGAFHYLLEG